MTLCNKDINVNVQKSTQAKWLVSHEITNLDRHSHGAMRWFCSGSAVVGVHLRINDLRVSGDEAQREYSGKEEASDVVTPGVSTSSK